MFLEGCFIETVSEAEALRPHGFAIVHPRGESVGKRVLYAQTAQVGLRRVSPRLAFSRRAGEDCSFSSTASNFPQLPASSVCRRSKNGWRP